MHSIFYLCLLAAPALANSQPVSRAALVGVSVQRFSHFYTTADGFPVNAKNYSSLVSGSPYFFDAFMPSALVLADGKTYTDVKSQLNLADNEVQYLDSRERLYMVVNNAFREVKKWKDGIAFLGDKAAAAEAHIKPLKERNAGLEELLTGALRFLQRAISGA